MNEGETGEQFENLTDFKSFSDQVKEALLQAILVNLSEHYEDISDELSADELRNNVEGGLQITAKSAIEAYLRNDFTIAKEKLDDLKDFVIEDKEMSKRDKFLQEKYKEVLNQQQNERIKQFQEKIDKLLTQLQEKDELYHFLEDLLERYKDFSNRNDKIIEARYWDLVDDIAETDVREYSNKFQTIHNNFLKFIKSEITNEE